MANERRRYPRVAAELPFRFVSERGEDEAFDLVDLSESGARIKCAHHLAAMTQVQEQSPPPTLSRWAENRLRSMRREGHY